jgi:hypothetical protein
MRKSFVFSAAMLAVAGISATVFAADTGTRNNEVFGGSHVPTYSSPAEGGFTEQFETGLPSVAPLPNHGTPTALTLASGTWWAHNRSTPIGSTGVFQQGGTGAPFPAAPGNGTFYAAMNFNNGAGLATINTFLMSPVKTFNNGDTISFDTRTVNAPAFPDRLRLRLSQNGASTDTNDFTTILLTVNPALTAAGYPSVWTNFTATLSGLPSGGVTGRFAFHYDVPNGGPSGANSDFIGIDNVVCTAIPEPGSMLALMGVAGLALVRRRTA